MREVVFTIKKNLRRLYLTLTFILRSDIILQIKWWMYFFLSGAYVLESENLRNRFFVDEDVDFFEIQ